MSVAISKDGVPLEPYVPEPPPNLAGAKPLPDEVYRARVDVAVALRSTQKLTNTQIAEVFGVTPSTVASWFRRARHEGRLLEDIHARLDKEMVHDALEVLQDHLEKGDLAAALALLKGRGVFRNHTSSSHEGLVPQTAIQIIYTTPDGAPPPALTDVSTLPGQIVGRGRTDDEPVKALP